MRANTKPESPTRLPPVINTKQEHYPFCVVWSPIPFLTWILPFVGHIGICDSHGRIYDFQGSHTVGQDRMIFSNPVKYWDVSRIYIPSFYDAAIKSSPEGEEAVQKEIAAYDEAVAAATAHFRLSQTYNLFSNNCHALVADSMNRQKLHQRHMGTVAVAVGMALHGRYVSTGRFLKAHLPFLLLVAVVIICAVVF